MTVFVYVVFVRAKGKSISPDSKSRKEQMTVVPITTPNACWPPGSLSTTSTCYTRPSQPSSPLPHPKLSPAHRLFGLDESLAL